MFVAGFNWPHEAILLLLSEYEKRKKGFISGAVSHKALWENISEQLGANGYNVTASQCQSKLAGMRKTYRNIKSHNKSGKFAKHWPYTTLMDDIIGDMPVVSCSSTGKKRILSKNSSGSDLANVSNPKQAKTTSSNQIVSALVERSNKIEENRERRFQELMAFKVQKAEEASQHKERALDLLERLINANNL